MIDVEEGQNFDLSKVKIKKHIPDFKHFRVFTFKNPKSKRIVKIMKCDSDCCGKYFRKWHNFFDHLRIHTNEKPYQCTYENCQQRFTQKANLNKHMELHTGEKRFRCLECGKRFYTNFNLQVSSISVCNWVL